MKRERSGVHLLLGLLLVFSASVGLLYGDKKGVVQPANVLKERCVEMEHKVHESYKK